MSANTKNRQTGKGRSSRSTARRHNIFYSDMRILSRNSIAVVLVVAMLLVPAFFAWVNIFGSWNPYVEESTARIPIALANADEGIDLMGMKLSVGSIVLDKLSESPLLGWQVKENRDAAVSAVNSGACYAAVIIPDDFTSGFLSVVEDKENMRHPTLEFYQNSKINGVVNSLLLKSRDTIKDQVNASLIGTVAEIVDKVFSIAASSGIDPDLIGEELANKTRDLTNMLDDILLAMEALKQLGTDGTQLLVTSADTIYLLGDTLNSGASSIYEADASLNTAYNLIYQSLSGITSIMADLTTTLNNVINLAENDNNPFPKCAEILTQNIAKLQNQRALSNDRIITGSIDNAVKELNSGLSVCNKAQFPDPGDLQQTNLMKHVNNAQGAIQEGYGELSSYSGSLDSCKAAINNVCTAIAETSADMLIGFPSFKANKDLYISQITDIIEFCENFMRSFPYNKNPLALAKTALSSALNKLSLINDYDAFITDKYNRGVEGMLNQANTHIQDSEKPMTEVHTTLDGLAAQLSYAVSNITSQFYGDPEMSEMIARLTKDIGALCNDVQLSSVKDTLDKVSANIAIMTGLYTQIDLGETLNEFLEAGRAALRDLELVGSFLGGTILNDITNMIYQLRNTLYYVQSMLLDGAGTGFGLSKVLGEYANAMGDANTTIDMAVELIERLDGYASKLSSDLDRITTTEGYYKLMEVVRNNPDAIADYLVTPVPQQTILVHHSENYGSSMSPYYIMFALYVGALLLPAFIKVHTADESQPLLRRFFGRYMIFFLIALAQGLLTAVGCLYFIGIQCYDPMRFILACALCAVSFSMINYALVFGMGMMGLGVSALTMIVQVAGADGTYPIDVLPDLFKKVYDFMPFRYGMDMLRETICGAYGNAYTRGFLVHVGLTVAFAAIGLALYYPLRGMNRMLTNDLNETGVLKGL